MSRATKDTAGGGDAPRGRRHGGCCRARACCDARRHGHQHGLQRTLERHVLGASLAPHTAGTGPRARQGAGRERRVARWLPPAIAVGPARACARAPSGAQVVGADPGPSHSRRTDRLCLDTGGGAALSHSACGSGRRPPPSARTHARHWGCHPLPQRAHATSAHPLTQESRTPPHPGEPHDHGSVGSYHPDLELIVRVNWKSVREHRHHYM